MTFSPSLNGAPAAFGTSPVGDPFERINRLPPPPPIPNPIPDPINNGLTGALLKILEFPFTFGQTPTGDATLPAPFPIGRESPETLGKIPFEGGQSDGVSYNVDALFRGINDGIGNTTRRYVGSGLGPISISKRRNAIPLDENSSRFLIQQQYFIRYKTNERFMEGVAGIDTQNPDIELIDLQITRGDGQPDTGGNPPPNGVDISQRRNNLKPGTPSGTYNPGRVPSGIIPGITSNKSSGVSSSIPTATSQGRDNKGSISSNANGLGSANSGSKIGGKVPGVSGAIPGSSITSISENGLGGGLSSKDITKKDTLTDPALKRELDKAKDVAPPAPKTLDRPLDLAGIKAEIDNLSIALPLALAGSSIFRSAAISAAKTGTCQAAQPNECLGQAINNPINGLGNKIDSNGVANSINAAANTANASANTANAAANTANTGLLGQIQAFLVAFQALVVAAFNNTIVDKAIGVLNLLTNVHNAAMLTTSIKDTLFEAISQGLAAIGIKSPEGSPIDVNGAVNKSTEALLKGILGAEQYEGLKLSWQKANRVIQSGAAIVNTTRSLYDSTRSLNELTGNNVGRIGNALKRDGVVSENAYKSMSENNNQVNSTMEKLQNLEQGVSTLASITSEAYNIRENVEQLTKNREDFDKAVKELPPKEQIENLVVKAKENTEKAVSQSPVIPLIDLYKPDI